MNNKSYSLQSDQESKQTRSYRRLNEDDKNNLIRQVFVNKLSIRKASQKLGINNSTAKVVIRNYKKSLKSIKQTRKTLAEKVNLQNYMQNIEICMFSSEITPIYYNCLSNNYYLWGCNIQSYHYNNCPTY